MTELHVENGASELLESRLAKVRRCTSPPLETEVSLRATAVGNGTPANLRRRETPEQHRTMKPTQFRMLRLSTGLHGITGDATMRKLYVLEKAADGGLFDGFMKSRLFAECPEPTS